MNGYREITTEADWKALLDASHGTPALVLKHSTRCPVSSAALDEYESYLQEQPAEGVDYVLVKVVEHRPVSNAIAEDLQLKHESPQIILVKDGASAWSATHWSVTKKQMKAVLHS